MSRTSLALATATAALLSTAGAAAAQACLGLPTRDGQIAVAGAYGVNDAYNTLGGQFHIDVTGPASFGFGAAFLVACDVLARTAMAPMELPQMTSGLMPTSTARVAPPATWFSARSPKPPTAPR